MSGTVHGVVFDGLCHNTGDKAGCLRTAVRPTCDRAGLGREFRAWLTEFVAGLEDAAAGGGYRSGLMRRRCRSGRTP